MGDKEALDLIQHYGWNVTWVGDAPVRRCILSHPDWGNTEPAWSLRDGVKAAIKAQAAWALAA